MDHKKQPRPLSLEDIFAEAAERVQAGEPVDGVIASYAPEFHKQLRGLLPIVETASHLHHAEIPAITTNRRSANRQALLQAAAQKRAQLVSVAPTPVRKPQLATAPTWGKRLAAFWAALQASFAPSPLRLAMSVIALVVLIFAPTTLVTQAQSAIPGDLTYPVKQWVRAQEIAFTPVDRLAAVRKQHEEENRADIEKAQLKADQQNLLINANAMLVFHGYIGDFWQIGGLHVQPCYQTDLASPDCQRMKVVGNLQPGAVVLLAYQILPGQPKDKEAPLVQGITLEVMQQPSEQEIEDTAAPTPVATITVPPLPTNTAPPLATDTPVVIVEPVVTVVPSPECTVGTVTGWVPRNVAADDTLAAIAARYGVSGDELRTVNCLTSDQIVPGAVLLVPDRVVVATPEPTVTETAPITGTVESPTAEGTATAEPTTPTGITPTVTSPITGTVAPPTVPAATSTVVVTSTAVATPMGTPLGTAVPLSTTTAAPTTTSLATPSETSTSVETPTPLPPDQTPAPTEPPGAATAIPTEVAPVTPAETPTEDGVAGASVTPVLEPPTAEPPATEPPPTAVVEPPTPAPLPLPTEPPPLATDTPAAASEGVMAAEAAPSTSEDDVVAQGETSSPSPGQPESPLPSP